MQSRTRGGMLAIATGCGKSPRADIHFGSTPIPRARARLCSAEYVVYEVRPSRTKYEGDGRLQGIEYSANLGTCKRTYLSITPMYSKYPKLQIPRLIYFLNTINRVCSSLLLIGGPTRLASLRYLRSQPHMFEALARSTDPISLQTHFIFSKL
jgi:hypothetical protein